MVKSEYFCDRCGKAVTELGAQYALAKIEINRHGLNPLRMDVCRDCSYSIAEFVESQTPKRKATSS